MSFEELCIRLGGRVENDMVREVLRCVIEKSSGFVPTREEARVIEQMVRDAARRGIEAEILIGTKLLGGWWEGVGISVDPRDKNVSIWSRAFGDPIEPNIVAEVLDKTIEKDIKEEGRNFN